MLKEHECLTISGVIGSVLDKGTEDILKACKQVLKRNTFTELDLLDYFRADNGRWLRACLSYADSKGLNKDYIFTKFKKLADKYGVKLEI